MLTMTSANSCTYNGKSINLRSTSHEALTKELTIDRHTVYLRGLISLDEVFRKHWNNPRIATLAEAQQLFTDAAREYVSINYPEDML